MTLQLYLPYIFNVKNKYLINKNLIPTIYFYFILFYFLIIQLTRWGFRWDFQTL